MADPTRTERQLLDSIRKAKSSPQPGETSNVAGATPSPAVESPQPPAAAATPAPEGDEKRPKASDAVDIYQAGRRVWPD